MLELITAPNGVQYLRSDLLNCRHGFSTRVGGISEAPHTASLNLAFERGDEDDTVLENLRRFADAIGVEAESIVRRSQIHSAVVTVADASMRGEGFFIKTEAEGDGFAANVPGIALAVTTADCVPILLEDPAAHVIGAVHAGWRGTAAGIAAECVRKMCSLGADAGSIRAAIGPAIHFCCYEVGDDFADAVAAQVGDELAEKYIRMHDGRFHADIAGLNSALLRREGVRYTHIDMSDFCTCCHPELFYSHRFSHGKRGAMLSVISL